MALVFSINFVNLKRSSIRFQAVSRVKGLFSCAKSVLAFTSRQLCLMSHLCSLPFQGYSSCCQIQNHTPAVWQFSSGQKNYETASVLLLNNNREFSRYKDIKLNSLGLCLPTGILTAGSFDQEQWQLGTCHKCFQFLTPSARA